ncbi:hypothetical protein ABZS83_33000 [Streptomyces sp. NPDC005426]|uniref:hypothetical protein n=1 Tax=Streptomyces sp. NPDC005426 TaxID=3155344 RepID=UPI0033A60C0C
MRNRTTTMAIATGLLLATLTACGGGDTAAGPEETAAEAPAVTTPTSPEPGKYEQTWPTRYADTTCGDYLTAMDDHQRWVLAADMLSGARKTDGAAGLPADSEVDRFQQDIATACEPIATAKTTEIGVSIYLTDATYKP